MKLFLKYWLPPLVWLGIIFVGSTDLMSAEHTSRFIVPILLWLKPDIAPATLESIHMAIRKCAHLSEYAVLALLFWRALRRGSAIQGKMPILFGAVLVACALFAASDEFHQSFVKSRTPSVGDVLLDIAGAVIGLLIGVSFVHRRPRETRGATQSPFVDSAL
jgi:VanZ family protein